MNEKIDLILEKISSLETSVQKLEVGQQKLEAGQQKHDELIQKNYDLIQKVGIKVEQVDSNVKGVAEGHVVLLNKMDEGFKKPNQKLDDTNLVVKETNRRLKEPACAL